MFGVAEFHDGHYEEVDVVDCKKDSICFITSDGTRYKYEENRRFLFQKYRPDYINWVFTDNIRRVMMTVTDDGKHELRGYLKKGEKEMGKDKMTKQLLEAQEAVSKAKKSLEKATEDLKKVEKMIEDAAKKKPMIYFVNGRTAEITKYHRYSDNCVEFDTILCHYRCIRRDLRNTYSYKVRDSLYIFQKRLYETFDYNDIDYIDRIELLEGVDEYADGWVRKKEDE